MQIQTDTSLLSDPRRQAALLYWQGFSVKQIAEMLKQKAPTVQSWKQRENGTISRRFPASNPALKREWCSSFSRQKEGSDYKEIDLLGRQIERLARVSRYMNSGNEADLNPNVANRNKGERKSRQRIISARKLLRSWRRFL